jgi:hypothetical protein
MIRLANEFSFPPESLIRIGFGDLREAEVHQPLKKPGCHRLVFRA